MLTKVEFGVEAIPYIDSCLLRGKSLAAHVLKNHMPETGQIFSYLPTNVTLEQKVRFVAGGIFKAPVSWQRIVDFISRFTSGPGKRYAVFEDAYAQSNDPWTQDSNPQFFSFRLEVYHFLTSRDQKREKIVRTLKRAGGYPFIGALTSLPADEPAIKNRQEVTEDILEELAKRTKHVLIGAYDNETMLIWNTD
jgi:hypothetical protein